MSIHRPHLTGLGAVCLAAAALVGGTACSHSQGASAPPATASAAAPPATPPAASPAAPPTQGSAGNEPNGGEGQQQQQQEAELVVSREIVARCPTLRLVKAHVEEFDPNTVWLAVLESIGECMSEGGPLAAQRIGVSGDDEHRHVVQEVLGSRGVAPARVVARPPAIGAAECQGGVDCGKRVELTLIPQ